jgi:hypothetical protein
MNQNQTDYHDERQEHSDEDIQVHPSHLMCAPQLKPGGSSDNQGQHRRRSEKQVE